MNSINYIMKSFLSRILKKNILKSNLCKLGILSLTNGITAVLSKYTLLLKPAKGVVLN